MREDGIGRKVNFTRRWSWIKSSRKLRTPPLNAEKLAGLRQ